MITVDDRGGSHGQQSAQRPLCDLKLALNRTPGGHVEAELRRLEFGDYAFVGNGHAGDELVGFELKTIKDLLSSLKSSRLPAHQVRGMTEMYSRMWLVVEGIWRPSKSGYFEYYDATQWTSTDL